MARDELAPIPVVEAVLTNDNFIRSGLRRACVATSPLQAGKFIVSVRNAPSAQELLRQLDRASRR